MADEHPELADRNSEFIPKFCIVAMCLSFPLRGVLTPRQEVEVVVGLEVKVVAAEEVVGREERVVVVVDAE